ncbi:hypothetical protein DH2020_002225 [Rehmannia glutinosa]|uniref:RNase H type-1 domain-containing protein n=1 Tax=Rehmannia glutinosa TaxID=99300 RepID=A0ABR0XTD1_REHGL
MSPVFYQKFWHIVGKDVTTSVLNFLNSKRFIPSSNFTHIVLIPKVKNTDMVSQFCPISRLIRSGDSTKIWCDPWLPREFGFYPRSAPHTLAPDATVSSLIDHSTNLWNSTLIKDIFSHDEAQLILSISLPPTSAHDLWMCHFTKNDKHSVCSAYHALLDSDLSPLNFDPNAYSSSGPNPIWKLIWELEIQPRIKLFLWRCCIGSIASSDNLPDTASAAPTHAQFALAKITLQRTSFFSAHSLRMCGTAPGYSISLHASNKPPGNLVIGPLEHVALHCSLIWYHRNRSKFNSSILDRQSVVLAASSILRDFKASHKWPERLSPHLASHHMFGSQPSGPRIFFDGAISPLHRCARVGIALLDEHGEFLSGFSKKFPGVSNPEVVKFLALKEALLLAHNLRLPSITIFGDTASVILTAHGEAICPIQCLDVCHEVLALKQALATTRIYWIQRALNTLAHSFAYYAKNMTPCNHLWDHVPTSLNIQSEWAKGVLIDVVDLTEERND